MLGKQNKKTKKNTNLKQQYIRKQKSKTKVDLVTNSFTNLFSIVIINPGPPQVQYISNGK